ncbi:MAG: hypothetical protein COA47_05710 [Robiginitomaculum sp.]|nr:MAG: hypothetical protein COA47_05710 [Robiginitomaculum sp.]
MYKKAPFIWTSKQKIDRHISFRQIVSAEPVRRSDGVNRWHLFRRRFSLASTVGHAKLSITVDGRYQLFINGQRLGRGPARSSPRFQIYDVHDVASYLKEGENVIAVLVHTYGVDTAWYETVKDYWQNYFGDGALYVDAEIQSGDTLFSVQSDVNWRCRESKAWKQDTPRAGWGQDFIEDFDAAYFSDDWSQVGFDDSAWDTVQILNVTGNETEEAMGFGRHSPFPVLVRRDFPFLSETKEAPVKFVASYGVVPSPELPLDRRVYDEEFIELREGYVKNPEALLCNDKRMTFVRTGDNCDVSLLIAFDVIHSAFPFIEIEAQGGEIIEVAVSETIPGEFDRDPPENPRIARQTHLDCANLFRYTARPGLQRFEKFEWTAVRYMQITVRNAPDGIRIRHAGSLYTHYPVENLGRFDCDDRFLNDLWKIGRHTVLQCTHDAWEDCPGREKRQWLGDGIVHYLASAAAFGPSTQPIDRRFFINASESQRSDGLIEMFSPGDYHDYGIVIPDFSLHWVCGANHYLQHTADVATIVKIYPAIQKALAWFENHIGPNGLLVDLPFWHFIEWANIGRKGEAAIINALYIGALRAAASMADSIDNAGAGKLYRKHADEMSAALNARHWNAKRGLYVDCVDPDSGEQEVNVSQHANAAMIIWGIAPEERWPEMVGHMANRDKLRLTAVPPIVNVDREFDPNKHMAQANTYFSHFVYQAFAMAGRFDLALDQICDFYRPMIEAGATALWESFEPSASLCHAFSASPVYHMSSNILGVTPLTPGFKKFQLWVQPCDLQQAEGVVATVHGDIEIKWYREDADLALAITVPEGTTAHIKDPPGYYLSEGEEELAPGSHHLCFTVRE